MLRENGTVELKPAPMTLWMRGLRSGDAAELKCPMRGIAKMAAVAARPGDTVAT